ncbi:AAA family ATPase [Catellatospora vulcania]|uniref:AAA family ATPase n=1 Tax=Catellatospora vulcania TaxID=1460450 RepID=UPI0012D42705|nr:AAA family ATPase [Catellatospora vulcania]
MLIVFSGLPGAGKTTLSRPVAAALGATWLRVDAIESALWRAGVDRSQPTGLAAYVVADALADAHLALGATVVVDAVNAVEQARAGWRDLAARHGRVMYAIEVVCTDAAEHRRRVRQRTPEPDQAFQPSWDDVRTREFTPWREPRLLVDTAAHDTTELATLILRGIAGHGTPA